MAVRAVADHDGPVYLRLIRASTTLAANEPLLDLEIGKAQVLKAGNDMTILASGLMVDKALEAAAELGEGGVDAAVVNVHTIKPLDEELVCKFAEHCGAVVTTPLAPAPRLDGVTKRDTTTEATLMQRSVYAAMSGSDRVMLAVQMAEDAKSIAMDGIRSRHPEFSEAEVHHAWLTLLHHNEEGMSQWLATRH